MATRPDVLLATPYLDEGYEAAIDSARTFEHVREGISVCSPTVQGVLQMLIKANQASGDASQRGSTMQSRFNDLPRLRGPDDVNAYLQYNAAATMMRDRTLAGYTDLLAELTGAAQVSEPESAEQGRQAGRHFIDTRAHHAASAALAASANLFGTWDKQGIKESAWERAMDVAERHNRRTFKNPVISSDSWERYGALMSQATAALNESASKPRRIAPSRFRMVTLKRGLELGYKVGREIDVDPATYAGKISLLERAFDIASSDMPDPIQLDAEQTRSTLAMLHKVRIAVANAARVDDSLAKHPAARHFAYVHEGLQGALAVNTEHAAFERAVKTAARQEAESPTEEIYIARPDDVPRAA